MVIATVAVVDDLYKALEGRRRDVREDGVSKAERVRLNGNDCPEKGQAYGWKAKQFTSDLAFGKEVTIQTQGLDKYGRTIGDVFLPDGRMLNEELVREGLAWWYRQYAPGNVTLEKLEAEAREAKRNLWSDPNPIPPWAFRKFKRGTAIDPADLPLSERVASAPGPAETS